MRFALFHRKRDIPVTVSGHVPGMSPKEASEKARHEFIESLTRVNIKLLDEWQGTEKPHRVQCANNHIYSVRPSGVRDHGIKGCRVCIKDNLAARFRNELTEIGATLLDTEYIGQNKRHRVECVNGHICYVRPADTHRGMGICTLCANKIWDVFYIVQSPISQVIKFGITSGSPKRRLRQHADNGYTRVLMVVTDEPNSRNIETNIKRELARLGYKPIAGNEYYDSSTLKIVLAMLAQLRAASAPLPSNVRALPGAGQSESG